MPDRMQYDERDPRHHTPKLEQILNDAAVHAREDIPKVADPKPQALFETTAEVLKGLVKAFEDCVARQTRTLLCRVVLSEVDG